MNGSSELEGRLSALEAQFKRLTVGASASAGGGVIGPGRLAAFSAGSCTNNCTAACTIGCTSGCTGGCGAEQVIQR